MNLSKERSCGKKIKYKNKGHAFNVLAKMQRKRYEGIADVYRCIYCMAWHIGHTPKEIVDSFTITPYESEKPERLTRKRFV